MARRRGGNKLFKKERVKKDFQRKSINKQLVKSIIIACEDSVSAPTYLQKIIDRLIKAKRITPNSVVFVPHDGATNPTKILQNLKSYKKNGISWRDFEHKWIVIDRDKEYKGGGHTKEDFNNALKNARSIRKDLHVDVAYSNDSFEVWYLLHFNYRNTPIMRDEIIDTVIRELKGEDSHKFARLTKENIKNEDYTKHIFDTLLKHQEKAIKNAQKLLESYGDEHNPESDNPSTTVHILVSLLNSLTKPTSE